jgi:deferrochelatase/peroxidase EfeB
MGAGPVMTSTVKERSSWRLKPPHDKQTQGIVVTGFSRLPAGKALFLFCDGPEPVAGKGPWLQTLTTVAPITASDGNTGKRAAAIAFTWTGLGNAGLSPEALATFAEPFREGMYQEDRLRRLGDRVKDKWQEPVIDGGPLWSGNILVGGDDGPREGPALAPGLAGDPPQRELRQVTTRTTVHALLLLYGETAADVQAWADEVEEALAPHRVTVVHQLALDLQLDNNGIGREHFGFADGISQPIPFGDPSGASDGTVVLSDGRPAPRDPWHGIPLGEILLGHTNAHAEEAPGPLVPDDGPARAANLQPEGAPEGFLNFGLNGSYMVVRELRQYVARFWQSLEDNAARIRADDPSATHVTADWLAERIVGRNIDGHLLCPGGSLPADEHNQPQNAFGFAKLDPHGHGCPAGSHVRRSNPRDGLAPDIASAPTLLEAANNHRILRRGRKYGTTTTDRRMDDGAERGLLFICLNADIARQFEFIQQTWMLNKNFATLYDETDPLVGPKGRFTIPEQPLRRIVDVQTFIQLAGGEYFFLPSLPALNYLSSLQT